MGSVARLDRRKKPPLSTGKHGFGSQRRVLEEDFFERKAHSYETVETLKEAIKEGQIAGYRKGGKTGELFVMEIDRRRKPYKYKPNPPNNPRKRKTNKRQRRHGENKNNRLRLLE